MLNYNQHMLVTVHMADLLAEAERERMARPGATRNPRRIRWLGPGRFAMALFRRLARAAAAA